MSRIAWRVTVLLLCVTACQAGESQHPAPHPPSALVRLADAMAARLRTPTDVEIHATERFRNSTVLTDGWQRRRQGTVLAGDVTVTGPGTDGSRITTRIIYSDGVIYLSWSVLSADLPEGKVWLKLDRTDLDAPEMRDFREFLQKDMLRDEKEDDFTALLRNSTQTRPARQEDDTTHYTGTVDITKMSTASGSLLRQVASQGGKRLDWDLWVDAQAYPRRLEWTTDLPRYGTVRMTETLTGWGQHKTITRPPSSVTVNLSEASEILS